MTVSVRVIGAERLGKVARDLKVAGAVDLRRELLQAVRTTAAPLKREVQQAARDQLPAGGGLNEFVASAKIGVRTRTTGRSIGVKLQGAKSGHDLEAIDRGRVRHPVYGNRRAWVNQSVSPGWWSKTLERSAPKFRLAIVKAMNDVARKVTT